MNHMSFGKFICFMTLTLSIWMLLPYISPAQTDFKFQKHFEEANTFLKAKQYEEAIKAYKEAITIDETQPAPYYNIACCYSLMTKTEKALIWFEKSLAHDFLDYVHIKRDTDLDNIRNEPGFKELVIRYHLEIEEKTDTLILKGFDSYITSGGGKELTSYCYLVACSQTRKAVIIDPSGGIKEIMNYLKENELDLQYILITHGYMDHIAGLKHWLEKISPLVCIHESSHNALQKWSNYDDIIPLKDGNNVQVGKLRFKIMHTPGHTPDSVCFYLERAEKLFSGDALNFAPDQIDKKTSDYFQKYFSEISEETKVYRGHLGYQPFIEIKKMVTKGR